ncbi:MAG: SatD family protein [Bacteroidetes bacterium]|nr:SatD family protein [Bacteroidota bacterium]MDA1120744.1 SatD family protein [Bacteroidota bacterium]
MQESYILMGDVILSAEKDSRELMRNLKLEVNRINSDYRQFVESPLTITLGDEFQGVLKSLKSCISAIFELDRRLLAYNFDLRYSINYGEIDTEINEKEAYEMLGSGLTKAREKLNALKKSRSRIEVSGLKDGIKMDRLNNAFRLYQSIYDDWKKKDRGVAYELIANNNYKQVAPLFDRDPSSMWRKRESLKIEEYRIAKALILSLAS